MARIVIANTSDGIAIKSGDVVEFSPGATVQNAATVNATSASLIGPPKESDKQAHLKVPSPSGRNVDCIRVAAGVSSAKVQAIAAECIGSRVASAVSVAGDKTVLRNISQLGEGRVLTFTGATNLDAQGLFDVLGTVGEYQLGAWGGEDPKNIKRNVACHVYGFDFRTSAKTPPTRVHSMRIEHSTDLKLGDEKFTLADGPGKGFAGYAEFDSRGKDDQGVGSWYGSVLNVKEAIRPRFIRLRLRGSIGLLAGLGDAKNPLDSLKFPSWRVQEPYFEGCELDVINFMSMGHGTVGLHMKHSIVRAIDRIGSGKVHGSIFEFRGQLGGWPASSGVFEDCEFFGDALTPNSNTANMKKNWQFVRCKFNGKAI